MKFSLIPLALTLTLATTSAQTPEPPVRDLLRDGLYAEEVANDPTAAAKAYRKILASFEEQRPFAANALFRLAELERKDGHKDEAIALYQRVLSQFPDATPQAALAKTRLTALGVKPGESAPEKAPDPEEEEMRKFESYLTSGPDLLSKPETYRTAVAEGWSPCVAFGLKHGAAANPGLAGNLLLEAVNHKQLAIVEAILAFGIDPHSGAVASSLSIACTSGYLDMARALLNGGADPNAEKGVGDTPGRTIGSPLLGAVSNNNRSIVELLLSKGADINRVSSDNGSSRSGRTPLQTAIRNDFFEMADYLLDHQADVNLAEPKAGITPLWLAAGRPGGTAIVARLLKMGADPTVVVRSEIDDEDANTDAFNRAVKRGSLESAKLLLAALRKTSPDFKPTIPQAFGWYHFDEPTGPDWIRFLLDEGAAPRADLLESAAEASGFQNVGVTPMWAIIEMLLDRGAPVDPEWKSRNFNHDPHRPSGDYDQRAFEEVRKRLLRRLSYPEWVASSEIRVVSSDGDVQILTANGDPATSATVFRDQPDLPKTSMLYRKAADGTITAQPLDLSKDAKPTPLHPGDILELGPFRQKRESTRRPR